MRQLTLFDDDSPIPIPSGPCPGCNAKSYDYGRWFSGLKLCEWCAKDRDVVRSRIRRFLPESPDGTDAAPGSDERIRVYAERVALGLSCFSQADLVGVPQPVKRRGAPDWRAEPGETGVERSGDKWRVRPAWRGRKWLLGTFPKKEQAVACVKAFWDVRRGDPRGGPALWMPCGDEDGAFAVEKEHIAEWRSEFPLVAPLPVCRQLRSEIRRLRPRPPMAEVWRELVRRLAAANGDLPAWEGQNEAFCLMAV